ncbi:MAG: DUF3187 family protein, partial [Thiohalorhabdus sp.]|uniref:DUF3187 family protein n=1 Tax=Thiohalorhabdus sp. TaxID=3094134 RepID=UPI00398018B7
TLSPVQQVYGLPRDTEPATAFEEGLRIRLDLDRASHDVLEGDNRSGVLFDGETQRTALSASGPLPRGLGAWTLEVPHVAHSGGFLDGAIDTWHSAFGLPEGNRPNRSANKLRYVVREDDDTILDRQRSASGLGDVALGARFPVAEDDGEGRAAVGVRVEAPTGDPDRLLGSGGWDTSLWAGGTLPGATWLGPGALHGAAGMVAMTGSEVLADLHRNWAGFLRLAGAVRPGSVLTLRAQMDVHTPFYRSEVGTLGKPTAEIRLGMGLELPGWGRLDLGFSEDITPERAPDVTFHLGWERRFGD